MSNIKGKLHTTLKPLDGAEGLLVAVVLRVVEDVRHPRPTPTHTTSAPTVSEQLSAIEWLIADQELVVYADLLQLDPGWLRHELQIAAGLAQGAPRLGQRRRPRHRETHKENPA